MMEELPLDKAFQLIEPGPVVLLTTAGKQKPNVMTLSWHMAMDFTPQIGCVIGSWDYSYAALHANRECVIAIPTVDIAGIVVDIGNCSGRDVDKFKKFGLTPLPAQNVKAPLIAECIANIECKVVEIIEKYNIVVLDGVKAWAAPQWRKRKTIHANGDGTFAVDGRTLNLKKRMVKWPEFI